MKVMLSVFLGALVAADLSPDASNRVQKKLENGKKLDRLREELENGKLAADQAMLLSKVDWTKVSGDENVRKLKSGGQQSGWGGGQQGGSTGGQQGGWDGGQKEGSTGGQGGWSGGSSVASSDCEFIFVQDEKVALSWPGSEVVRFSTGPDDSSDVLTCTTMMCAGDAGLSVAVRGTSKGDGVCETEVISMIEWVSYLTDHDEEYAIYCPRLTDTVKMVCDSETFPMHGYENCDPELLREGPFGNVSFNGCDPGLIKCKITCTPKYYQ